MTFTCKSPTNELPGSGPCGVVHATDADAVAHIEAAHAKFGWTDRYIEDDQGNKYELFTNGGQQPAVAQKIMKATVTKDAVLKPEFGGTGAAKWLKGDLLAGNGIGPKITPAGAEGLALKTDPAKETGIAWKPNAKIDVFNGAGTWTKPAGASVVFVGSSTTGVVSAMFDPANLGVTVAISGVLNLTFGGLATIVGLKMMVVTI